MAQSREMKKWVVVRRAQFGLKVALDRIDYMEDVVRPELEALERGEKKVDSTGHNLEDAKRALREAD